MHTKRIVVIGTSAGGIEALRTVAAALPADFPAAIAIVMHVAPQSPGLLHDILNRAGPLPAHQPRNGERIAAGHIYVAPPDCHLLIEPGVLRVTKGPKENRFRPAVDPLFRSAAQVFGPAAIGVVLTGNLDDGAAGLWTIKQLGGVAIVQEPDDALFPSMPRSALEYTPVDYRVSLADLAPLLVRLTTSNIPQPGGITVPERVNIEVNIAKEHNAVDAGVERVGEPSSIACPQCHGVLLQLKEAGRIRFRCHTGHAYSAESLIAEIGEGIEDAMWNAIRALEEGRLLLQQMSTHLHDGPNAEVSRRLSAQAEEAHRHSEAIRELVSQRETLTTAKS